MAKTAISQNSPRTPTHDEIAAQAYQIYLREGCQNGCDLEHWLKAEEELRANGNGQSNGNNQSANGNGNAHAAGQRNGASRSPVEAPSSSVMTAAASPSPTPPPARNTTPPNRKPALAKR